MKITPCILCGVLALFLAPLTSHAAKKAGKGKPSAPSSTGEPSVQLRHLIDTTMRKISDISNPKQPPLDRTSLMVAQAEYTAKVQTALPAQQPMYQASLYVVNSLIAAVEEHEKAVADFHYSKNVHGKQDREDAKVANWQRGPDAGAAARADNAKQKMENQASRNALLDKEKFMSNGTLANWQQRVGQLHDAVEQALTKELVAEQQLAMAKAATPAPVPVPKATPKPAETSAATAYSPTGSWKTATGSWTLSDDGNFMAPHGRGTWEWSDRSKRELSFHWRNKAVTKGVFSADCKTIDATLQNGQASTLTR